MRLDVKVHGSYKKKECSVCIVVGALLIKLRSAKSSIYISLRDPSLVTNFLNLPYFLGYVYSNNVPRTLKKYPTYLPIRAPPVCIPCSGCAEGKIRGSKPASYLIITPIYKFSAPNFFDFSANFFDFCAKLFVDFYTPFNRHLRQLIAKNLHIFIFLAYHKAYNSNT